MEGITLTAAPDHVVLGPEGARVTVSVTNQGPAQERVVVAVLSARPSTGPQDAPAPRQPWRAEIDRSLRTIAAGATEQFLVSLSAEAERPGTHEARIIAYSADTAPEEQPASEQIIRLEIPAGAPTVRRRPRWWIPILLVALLLAVAATAFWLLDGDGDEPPQPTLSPTATQTPSPQESPTDPATPSPAEPETPSPTETEAPTVDIQMFSLPECTVNGGTSDALTIFVAFRDGGPDRVDRLVPYTMVSDTGLSTSGSAGISTGSAFSGLQVGLLPTDYGRAHTFTITADPDDAIPERDETNNTLRVRVELPPSQPPAVTGVPCAIR